MNIHPFKLSGLSCEETYRLIPHYPILVGYRGSIAHNMYIPDSDPLSVDDKDVMAIVIAPKSVYLGLDRYSGDEFKEDPYDIVIYELCKFVSLLKKANPNVLSILWLREEHYIYKNRYGALLIANRKLFVSKKIYHSFTGYAYSQLKRMTHTRFHGRMGEKRKRLVEEFGYDTKNAAHLIRLLRMGIEFLVEGYLYVHRQDAPQLMEIKRGKWKLEQVQLEADRLFKQAESVYVNSRLPSDVDHERVNALVIEILSDYFRYLSFDSSPG